MVEDAAPTGRLVHGDGAVEGEDLSKRLKRGKMSVDEALKVFGPITNALAYAHQNNIAHRDIKPANIMVRPDGIPVVVDFGIAVSAGQTRMTIDGGVPGTVAYMPPEVFAGGELNPRSGDAYALGVVMEAHRSGIRAGDSVQPTLRPIWD